VIVLLSFTRGKLDNRTVWAVYPAGMHAMAGGHFEIGLTV